MRLAYILLTFSMLFFSGNFIIGKAFSDDIPPFTMSLMRFTIGSLILLPICFRTLMTHVQLWKKEWRALTSISITGVVLFNVCLYSSVHFTSTTNAALVDALTPAVAAVIGYFWLKERLIKIQIFGILLSFFGVFWIISDGSLAVLTQFRFNIGDLIMLVGIIFWAIYSILIKKHGYKFPLIGGLVMTMILGVLLLFPFALLEWRSGFPLSSDLPTIGALLYIGIFPSALALVFWYRGVEEIGPSQASIFFNLVPLFVAILSYFFLGEVITIAQVLGGMLILTGVYLATKRARLPKQVRSNQQEVENLS